MPQRTTGRRRDKINHVGYLCEAHEKILLVIDILLRDKPDSSIIFCNTGECVTFVRKYLQRCGFIVPAARPQRSVVVASDEAARGVQQRYHCVINFDMPFAVRNYTARLDLLARNTGGPCISFLCDHYSDFAPPIIARYRLQCSWPAANFNNYHLPDRQAVKNWLALSDNRKQAHDQERTHHKGRQASKSPQPRVSYASRKANQIVAAKSRRKSVWERILSFLTK